MSRGAPETRSRRLDAQGQEASRIRQSDEERSSMPPFRASNIKRTLCGWFELNVVGLQNRPLGHYDRAAFTCPLTFIAYPCGHMSERSRAYSIACFIVMAC